MSMVETHVHWCQKRFLALQKQQLNLLEMRKNRLDLQSYYSPDFGLGLWKFGESVIACEDALGEELADNNTACYLEQWESHMNGWT